MAALTVEPAYAFNLLIGWGGYGRAPPDLMVEREIDGGLDSRAPPVLTIGMVSPYRAPGIGVGG